jgi:hypothetical protein
VNRIFPNGNGGPKRKPSPEEVDRVLSAVRAGDPKVCVAFAQQTVALLDRGVAIRPRGKPTAK